MKTVEFYFDFLSPFAYLANENLGVLPEDIEIVFKPVLLAGLMEPIEFKGQGEVPEMRRFLFRHTTWLAAQAGIEFTVPSVHPFKPLLPLRLCLALGSTREVVSTIFRYIWAEGKVLDEGENWLALTARLGLQNADELISQANIKTALRDNTEAAISAGVFGVPTFIVENEKFWGMDSMGMLCDFIQNPDLFQQADMLKATHLPEGKQRQL